MPSGNNQRNKTIEAIQKWRDNGFSVEVIAKEFGVSEAFVRKQTTKDAESVERVGKAMLKRPNYRVVKGTFNGDLEAYRRCVEMVFFGVTA